VFESGRHAEQQGRNHPQLLRLAGGIALFGVASVVIMSRHQQPTVKRRDQAKTYATCDNIIAINHHDNSVQLRTNYTLSNGAEYAGISYIFDRHETATLPILDPRGQTEHQYASGVTQPEVTAIVNYHLPNDDRVFGAPAVCHGDIVLK